MSSAVHKYTTYTKFGSGKLDDLENPNGCGEDMGQEGEGVGCGVDQTPPPSLCLSVGLLDFLSPGSPSDQTHQYQSQTLRGD